MQGPVLAILLSGAVLGIAVGFFAVAARLSDALVYRVRRREFERRVHSEGYEAVARELDARIRGLEAHLEETNKHAAAAHAVESVTVALRGVVGELRHYRYLKELLDLEFGPRK